MDLLNCRNPWVLWYPPYPGHQPSPRSAHATKQEAWEAGQAELADRPDLVGQDVTIVSLEQSRRATGAMRFTVSSGAKGNEFSFELTRDLRLSADAVRWCRTCQGFGGPTFGGPAASVALVEWAKLRVVAVAVLKALEVTR